LSELEYFIIIDLYKTDVYTLKVIANSASVQREMKTLKDFTSLTAKEGEFEVKLFR
jgi:hypothetical protein